LQNYKYFADFINTLWIYKYIADLYIGCGFRNTLQTYQPLVLCKSFADLCIWKTTIDAGAKSTVDI